MSLSSVIANAVSLKNLRLSFNRLRPEKANAADAVIDELNTTDELSTEPSATSEDGNTSKADIEQIPETTKKKTQNSLSETTERSRRSKKRMIGQLKRNANALLPLNLSPCHTIVEQIFLKLNELEFTLHEDQQHEFKLRMALERQSERIHDLRFSLDAEKQRNQRLVQLIHAANDEKNDSDVEEPEPTCALVKWLPTLDSISPLLMQQRYDELSASYKHARCLLAKKEKRLNLAKCETEVWQAKHEHLFDEYRNEQKRFKDVCGKYLMLQSRKKQEIQMLRKALSYATDCIINAQELMENCDHAYDKHIDRKFQQNLKYLMTALRRYVPNLHRQPQTSPSSSDISPTM